MNTLKFLVVAGPTGTGKTDFALKLAKKNRSVLINADSRQIYKDISIGTNKEPLLATSKEDNFVIEDKTYNIPVKQIKGINIHLIDFLEIIEQFNLFIFQNLAYQLIENLNANNVVPIIVGGTGLYIDSLLKGYNLSKVEPNIELRNDLNKLDLEKLQNKLIDLNLITFNTLNSSDKSNKHRLIRLIEKNLSSAKNDFKDIKYNLDYKVYYPKYNWEDLKNKLKLRVQKMFESGLIDEAKSLRERYSDTSAGFTSCGYKILFDYLDNKISIDECKTKFLQTHISYAKRQRTWFERGRGYKLEVIDFDNY